MKNKIDFLIVGQGIAGSMLAWFLLKSGKTFFIIDRENQSSSSRVAAGIIHPVTGRRIVKTWMAETLIPFAESTYKDIENFFGVRIYDPQPVLELIASPKEYNDWMVAAEDFSSFIQSSDAGDEYDDILQPFYKKIVIRQSSRIDIGAMLSSFRKYFIENGYLIDGKFKPEDLKIEDDAIRYQRYAADRIIFCEGAAAVQNPFFRHLPFLPVKGEIITVTANMKLQHILNRKIFILQVGEETFRVGSTYEWNYNDALPTKAAREELTARLKSMVKIPFKVIGQDAAIRPAVKNRRPLLGLHPVHDRVGIFNGLGTKGCLLAPFFANHLVEFLSGKSELMGEVDVGKRN